MIEDIVEKLRIRAKIRRSIPRAKAGEIDRISDLCEEAANEIERLQMLVVDLEDQITGIYEDMAGEDL